MNIQACLFFYISLYSARKHMGAWILKDGLAAYDENGELIFIFPLARCYLRSLYTTATNMVPAGFGDITPQNNLETIEFIFFVYVGYYFQVTILSNIKNFVGESTKFKMAHEQEVDDIMEYLTSRNISIDVQRRVRSFYDYMYHLLEGLDEDEFINDIPPTLRAQVAGEISGTLIKQIPFLRSLDPLIINNIVLILENSVYSPGDVIVPRGKLMKTSILFNRGEIEIINSSGKVQQTINCDQGHIEYETACVITVEAENQIRAKSYCETYELNQDKLRNIIIKNSPESWSKIEESAMKAANSEQKRKKLLGDSQDSSSAKIYTGFKKIFLPNSHFRIYWDFINVICNMYIMFIVPYSLCYYYWDRNTSFYIFIIIMNCICDVIFICDVILRMSVFAYEENGIIICTKSAIFINYKKQHPIIDIITAIPFEYIFCVIHPAFFNFIRIIKLLRCVYIPNQLKSTLNLFMNFGIYFTTMQSELFKWLFLVVLVAHYLGVLFYFVGLYRMNNHSPLEVSDDWITTDNNDPSLNINHDAWNGWAGYLRSVYWAIVSTTSVGYGDIKPLVTSTIENIYVTLAVVFGGIAYPVLLGSLASVLEQFGHKFKEFKAHVEELRGYFKENKIEKKIRDKSIEYNDYIWSRQHGVDENQVLNALPLPLRTEILKQIINDRVMKIPFMQFIDPEVLSELFGIFEPIIFLPDTLIIQEGTSSKGLYIIEKGIIRMSYDKSNIRNPDSDSDNSLLLTYMSNPQFFGEESIINIKSLYSYYSEGYCDCFLLPKNMALELLEDYPETRDQLKDDILDYHDTKRKIYQSIIKNFGKEKISSKNDLVKANVKKVSIQSFSHPESYLRRLWNIICYIIMVYFMIIEPLRFVVEMNDYYLFFIIEWLLNIIMLSDFYLHLTYFGYMEGGTIHYEKSEIKKHYIHSSHFIFHLIGTMPWEIIVYFLFIIKDYSDTCQIISYIRLTKIIYMLIYSDYYSSLMRVLEDYPSFPQIVPKIFSLLIKIVLVSHIFSAFYLFLGRYNNDGKYPIKECEELYDRNNLTVVSNGMSEFGACLFEDTWLQKQMEWGQIKSDGDTEFTQYMRSIYFCITTLLTADIGDSIPISNYETLFTIILLFVGILVSSTVIGEIANISINTNDNLKNNLYNLDKYLTVQHIPYDISLSCYNYFDNFVGTRKATGEEKVISDLPSILKNEISLHYKYDYISSCILFENVDKDSIEEIALLLKYNVYYPDDTIYKKYNHCSELYFIKSGTVRLYPDKMVDDNSQMSVTLEQDDFFGEYAFFFDQIAHEYARAISFVDMIYLKREDLATITKKRQINVDIFFNNLKDMDTFQDPSDINSRDRKLMIKTAAVNTSYYINKTEVIVGKNLYFTPTSQFVRYWKTFGYITLLYYLITIPFVLAFYTDRYIQKNLYMIPFYTLDIIFLIYWIIDSILASRYFAFMSDGMLITSNKEIWKHYKSKRMIFDIITLFPVDIIALIIPNTFPYLRILRIFRLINFQSYTKNFTHLISEKLQIAETLCTLLLMLSTHFIICHYGSCIWFFVHRFIERDEELTWAIKDSLATYDPINGEHDVMDNSVNLFECYLRGIHFTLSVISSVGIGDIRPYNNFELFVTIAFSVVTCYLSAIYTSLICDYILVTDDNGEHAYLTKLRRINKYMKKRHFSDDLIDLINDYYDASWKNMKGVLLPSIIKDLPVSLQEKIYYNVYKDRINKIEILKDLPEDIKMEISLYLKVYSVREKEYLYRENQNGKEIYFILSGSFTKYNKTESTILKEGESFGSFKDDLIRNKNKYSVRGDVPSLLLTIDIKDLDSIRKIDSDADNYDLFINLPSTNIVTLTGMSVIGNKSSRHSSRKSILDTLNANIEDPFRNFSEKREKYVRTSLDKVDEESFVSKYSAPNTPVHKNKQEKSLGKILIRNIKV